MKEPDRVPAVGSRALAFGPFLIDLVRRLVWHNGRVVAITDKAFDVLATLLEHRDRVLGKDELLKRVWPDTFVQENNLVRHVSMLRRSLGQSPDQHDYIVTVPGIGYRFVAPVTELDSLPPDLPTSVIHDSRHGARADEAVGAPPGVTAPADAGGSPDLPPLPTPGTELAAAPPLPEESGLSNQSASPHAEPVAAEPAANAGSATATPEPPPGRVRAMARRSPWMAVTAAVIVTAVTLIAARRVIFPQPGSGRPRSLRQVTYGPDVQVGPTWSSDGRALAFSSNRTGDFEIWVQPLDQPDPVRITQSPGPDWQPSWSPDGKLIAFRSERQGGGIYVISPRGEGLRRISDFGYQPSWSRDSSRVLFQSGQVERLRPQPYVVGLDGGPPRLARPDLMKDWSSAYAAWHPDGELSLWGRDDQGRWTLAKAPATDGPAVSYVVEPSLLAQMSEMDLALGRFAWAPSGEFVYFEGVSMQVRNLWRVRVDRATLAWLRPPERLTLGEGADSDISVSGDGSRIAFGAVRERTRLWSLPLDPSSGRAGEGDPLTSGGAGEFDAAVSADGRTLIYRTTRFGRQELWARTIADDTQRLLITGTDWIRSSPRLSNDGRRVAYRLTRTSPNPSSGGPAVAVLEPNGVEIVVSAPGAPTFIPDDWSTDDSTILGACLSPVTLRFGVCTIAAEPNSQPIVLATDPDREFYSPHYSPNHRWISVVERQVPRPRDWTAAITAIPVHGGPRIRITDGSWNDEKPRWSSDGRAVYFLSNRGGFLNVWGRRFDPQTGTPQGPIFQVTHFDNLDRHIPTDLMQVETSVSGNRIFLPVTELTATIWTLDGANR